MDSWQQDNGTIDDSGARVRVTCATDGCSAAGGLVGQQQGGSIANSYATGAVTGGANGHRGGLVGYGSVTITTSYFDTNTTGQTHGAGWNFNTIWGHRT